MRNKWYLLGILSVCVGCVLAAEKEQPYKSLVDNSPFLTPAFKARLGKHDTTTLKFVGYTKIGKVWLFALINKKTGQTHWIKMNEETKGIKIESFDAKAQTIHLIVGGIGLDLALVKE